MSCTSHTPADARAHAEERLGAALGLLEVGV